MQYLKWLMMVVAIGLFSGCATTESEKQIYSQVKRPLTNDFALAISLLNRPIPEDQLMMLAFAKQQESQWGYSHYVSVLGPKEYVAKPKNTSWLYQQIQQDDNAITISSNKL